MSQQKRNINRANYMTTGQFAKAMKVTKNTLFHYDAIGLFSPEIVLENDYRYYSVYQMELFDTILQLKELGMSLSQIKAFLERRSPHSLKEVYERREQQIDAQIKSLRKQKQWITEQKSKIRQIAALDFSGISIRHYPKRYFVYITVSEKTDAEFIRRTTQIITEFLKNNPYTDFDIGYLQNSADIHNGVYDNCDNILLITSKKPVGMNYRILEEGTYLSAYHKGHWDSIGRCYERLLSYAKENHLPTESDFLEYYVIDSLMAANIDNYVTEVSVRMK